MSEAVIQIESLKKTYRSGLRRTEVVAIKNLSLTVKQGTIVAFVGPNGAGTTTTIHSMLGFLKTDAGSIRLFVRALFNACNERALFSPSVRGRAAEGGRGSLTHHLELGLDNTAEDRGLKLWDE